MRSRVEKPERIGWLVAVLFIVSPPGMAFLFLLGVALIGLFNI